MSPTPESLPCGCTTLRKAARAVSRLYDQVLQDAGMTTPQLALLRAVGRAGEAPLSRLAETMVMDRTSLYRALTPLIRRGWLEIAGAGRGRSKIARLTPAGEAATDAAAPHWEAAQRRFIGALGPELWSALSETLLGVVDTASAA
jgi:DNA-binding MarR family transcriptional regulator